jgi:hypothetical protein
MYSDDEGRTWQALVLPDGNARRLVFLEAGIFALSKTGFFVATSRESAWVPVDFDTRGFAPLSFTFSFQQDGSKIYTLVDTPKDVYLQLLTRDGGRTWQLMASNEAKADFEKHERHWQPLRKDQDFRLNDQKELRIGKRILRITK